jgi:hypothetical protein|nr:MAG TPA: hypothetical protein [Caudoviricetes sp.]
MEATPLTAADVGAVVDNKMGHGYGYGDGFGYGGSWIWVILLFAIFGGGFGYGNRGYGLENALTRSDLQQGFDNQSVMRKLDGITNGICDGFYATNTNLLQGQNQLQRDLCQGFAAVNAGISENRFAAQQCCCETNRNIDAIRYENAKNTCEIVRAIEKDGDATRALINANTMQALRDKIVAKDQELQTANFQLSQQAQSANLIEALRPCAKPAYITCSPYFAQGMYGYGCGCGNFA